MNAKKPRTRGAGRPRSRTGGAPVDEAQAIRRGIERERKKAESERFVLRLYVTGVTPASAKAIERVKEVCERRLHGRYELDVIDIYQLPSLAKDHQIVATPTLIKELPAPLRRYIGDLSKIERVLFGLDLQEKP